MQPEKSQNKGFTVETTFAKCSTLSDKALSLIFHTSREQKNHEQNITVMEMTHQTGWLLFSPDPIQESAVPGKSTGIEGKSPSQRLHAVLFVLWKQQGEQGDFDEFYKSKMTSIIDHFKNKLI